MAIADRMLALLSPLIADRHDDGDDPADDAGDENGDQPGDDDDHDAHDHTEELTTLLRWLQIDRFDRRATNRHLAQLEMTVVQAAA